MTDPLLEEWFNHEFDHWPTVHEQDTRYDLSPSSDVHLWPLDQCSTNEVSCDSIDLAMFGNDTHHPTSYLAQSACSSAAV